MTLADLGGQALAVVAPAVLAAVGAVAVWAFIALVRLLNVQRQLGAIQEELAGGASLRTAIWRAVSASEEQSERVEKHGAILAGDAAVVVQTKPNGDRVVPSDERDRLAVQAVLAQYPDIDPGELRRELDASIGTMRGVGATGDRVVASAFVEGERTDPAHPFIAGGATVVEHADAPSENALQRVFDAGLTRADVLRAADALRAFETSR